MRRLLLFGLILLSILTPVLAQQGHLTLLTVAESDDPLAEQIGGTADLYLEIRPGTGQIFIDSFPLTKLDTQSSTRFANKVACNFLDIDCSEYDFFYTIRAGSTVVGGPSAGAAIAVLTVALLNGDEFNESIAITGTINSGAIVGPVAGVKAKATAAKEAGITTVLISSFSTPTELNRSYFEEMNQSYEERLNFSSINLTKNATLNLSKLYTPVDLSTIGIPIVNVASLGEALTYFTSYEQEAQATEVKESEAYATIMASVADSLCERRDALAADVNASALSENATARRRNALEQSDWYSAASYCFSDLISLRSLAFEALSNEERENILNNLEGEITTFERELKKQEFTTLAGLETSVIVSQRLLEARETVERQNRSNISAAALGFAYERYNSAKVWSAFFKMPSKQITIDETHLEAACDTRIMESEERIQYAELYLPSSYLDEAAAELTAAKHAAKEGAYPLCLFSAGKAQATANILSGSLAIKEENVEALVEGKLKAVAAVIQQQEERGYFPILGYSYYRYATSLEDHDQYSALTFAEYALELSNLDVYFPREKSFSFPYEQELGLFILFLSGALFGGAVTAFFVTRHYQKQASQKGKKKRVKKTRKRA